LQGRAALPPGADRASAEGGLPHPRRRRDPPLGGGQEHGLRRHLQPRGVERHRRDARGAVRGRAAPAALPRVGGQQADNQGHRPLPLRARRQAQPGGLGTALLAALARSAGCRRADARELTRCRATVASRAGDTPAPVDARGYIEVLGSPSDCEASWALALRIVNSPVMISSPSAIITAPPSAMTSGKWRLTIANAAVMRSNASAISRNGIASPAE